MKDIIVGTAGHIDHGKTALVRALTGTDADRLPEEKQRGITIDIGFAELDLGELHFGFVDVPGHERFVKNMLAGASGINVVLLIIAADEGVMPQTREHFEICRLLGLSQGIVVLTKSDRVDSETLELAQLDAAELVAGSFLDDAPVIPVSSISGSGLDTLKTELVKVSRGLPQRSDRRAALLPIDRSFSMKGFGSVVTGTLASGEIAAGDEVELLPEGRSLRVRGVQTHGRAVNSAHAGQRTAVNLAGIEHSELERGMTLAKPGIYRPTQMIDAEVEVLPDTPRPLRSRQRVRLHVGTAELLARIDVLSAPGEIAPGAKGFVQLRTEAPAVCVLHDRFILRSYSPQRTIGGGRVVVASAQRHRQRDRVETISGLEAVLAAGDDAAAIVAALTRIGPKGGTESHDLQASTGWETDLFKLAMDAAIAGGDIAIAGTRAFSPQDLLNIREAALGSLKAFHGSNPLEIGIPKELLRDRAFRHLPDSTFAAVLASMASDGAIAIENQTVRLAEHRTELSESETRIAERLRSVYAAAGFAPPKTADVLAEFGSESAAARSIFEMLIRSNEIVKVTDDLSFASAAIADLKQAIREFADHSADRVIDVPRFKEIAGVSRKYAIPLLEYFDREKLTMRAGEKRVVLK